MLMDRCFQMYRRYFVKWLQLSFIMYAPFIALLALLIPRLAPGGSFWYGLFDESGTVSASLDSSTMSGSDILLFVLLFLGFFLIILPFSMSIGVWLVGAINRQEPIRMSELLKRGLRRTASLSGSTILYGLTMFGIWMAISMATMTAVFLVILVIGAGVGMSSVMSGSLGAGAMSAMIVIFIFMYILLAVSTSVLMAFFTIRWAFYIPLVAERRASVGISLSWRITRGHFWRIYAVHLTLLIMFMSVWFTAMAVPNIWLNIVIQIMLSVLLLPLFWISYGVTYHELMHRYGDGLMAMLEKSETRMRLEAEAPRA